MFPKRFLGFPIGWKDLGKIKHTYKNFGEVIQVAICPHCHRRARVGKEKDEIFYFCPKCEKQFDLPR